MENIKDNPDLQRYVKELLKWNKSVNLIGRKTETEIWDVHIEDSLALQPYLAELNPAVVVDIGSGGGLPAIPLAIYNPDIHFIMTDVIKKKTGFMEWACSLLRLNAEVIDISQGFQYDKPCLITSRAFSELSNILDWQARHAPRARDFLLLKGTEETTLKEIELSGLTDYTLIPRERGCILTFSLKE